MNILLPCEFRENVITSKGLKTLIGATWFKWVDGMEFTYFYQSDSKWGNDDFEVVKNAKHKPYYEINDSLIKDGFLKDKGYPIKGRGYICGLRIINDKLYAHIILTDKYLAHIYVECNKNGMYKELGSVFVPPSWDTEEKQKSIILEKYKGIESRCINCN